MRMFRPAVVEIRPADSRPTTTTPPPAHAPTAPGAPCQDCGHPDGDGHAHCSAWCDVPNCQHPNCFGPREQGRQDLQRQGRAVRFLAAEFPGASLPMRLDILARCLKLEAGKRTPFEAEVVTAYYGGPTRQVAVNAVALYRANQVQRRRAAKADALHAAAAYLLEQRPDETLAECQRLVVGILNRYHKTDSESLTPHVDVRED